jgi:hypothetical protein
MPPVQIPKQIITATIEGVIQYLDAYHTKSKTTSWTTIRKEAMPFGLAGLQVASQVLEDKGIKFDTVPKTYFDSEDLKCLDT